MSVFVRGIKTHSVDINEVKSVTALKQLLADISGIGISDQILSYHGKPLRDNVLFTEYNIINNSTIDFSLAINGGKVHGSLARAGKVKGQTPKVEKQEKKKAKTGRAKRRIQYNRRFVNVVNDPRMKRKGPNSNS